MAVQNTYNKKRAFAYEGMLVDGSHNDIAPMRNDEASAEIAFGVAVKFDSTSDEQSAKLLTAITGELVAGITILQHSYASSQLGDDGVKAGESLNIMRKGRIWVICEDGCNVGDRLHIRAVAAGAEKAGALLSAADGTDTIDSTKQGQWLTSAAAGELAVLEVNFFNEID